MSLLAKPSTPAPRHQPGREDDPNHWATSAIPGPVSGHSLRAGLATAAALAGTSERTIMNQTGHTSVRSVRRFIRDAQLFRDNAAAAVL